MAYDSGHFTHPTPVTHSLMENSTLVSAISLAGALVFTLMVGVACGAAAVWLLLGLTRPQTPIAPAALPSSATPPGPDPADLPVRDLAPPPTPADPPATDPFDADIARRTIRALKRDIDRRTAREAAVLARARQITARDRAELIALQNEIEAEARIGMEKARLLRSAESDQYALLAQLRATEDRAQRLQLAVMAAMASIDHAKRAQAQATGRLARSRERMREHERAPAPAAHPPLPGERVVYRDRDVPVEVPVGFSTLRGEPRLPNAD